MIIVKEAVAGSLESSDCLIMVKPSDSLELELDSVIMKRYGKQIEKTIMDTIKELDVTAGYYKVKDMGALDYCLRARVISVTRRGSNYEDR